MAFKVMTLDNEHPNSLDPSASIARTGAVISAAIICLLPLTWRHRADASWCRLPMTWRRISAGEASAAVSQGGDRQSMK